jgi:hypothetical protein
MKTVVRFGHRCFGHTHASQDGLAMGFYQGGRFDYINFLNVHIII